MNTTKFLTAKLITTIPGMSTCSYMNVETCKRVPTPLFGERVRCTTHSVPLRTGTCYIRDIFVLFLQDHCALQELLMKMNLAIPVAPPFVHPMTSLLATPTHSVQKYGLPTRRRQVAKYGNLKRCESLSFSGDIQSLEPSKF